MDYLFVSRENLDGFHVARPRYWNRDHEVAKHIRALGLKVVGYGQLDNQVGLAKLPPIVELRGGLQIRYGSPLDSALFHPALNDADLILG